MPVGFLNSTQHSQLSSFPTAINHNDLITFFTLTEQDKQVLPSRSSATNRLGFAIQLCALRFMGFFIKELADVPTIITEYLTEQLALEGIHDLIEYGRRLQTRTDHMKVIENHLCFSPADAVYENKLQEWLVSRSLEHERPILLLHLTAEKMKHDKRTRYGLWKLEKLVSQAREESRQIIFESIQPYLTEKTKSSLDQLLIAESAQTELTFLTRKAASHSPESILLILNRISRLRELGTEQWDLSHLNRNRLKYLAQLGKRSTNQALQRSRVERRYPVLIACLSELLHECIDESIGVFDLCISEAYRRHIINTKNIEKILINRLTPTISFFSR